MENQHLDSQPSDNLKNPQPLPQEETVDIKPEELQQAKDEAKKHYEAYLRSLADFENLRRRTQKEKEEFFRFGAEDVLRDLLPILDSLEKVSGHSGEDFAGFVTGVQLIRKQFLGILEQHGLNPVEAHGQSFDPTVHQAISRVEKEGVTQEVIHEEFIKGYRIHDRLLRPAMVSVAVPASVTTEN